MKFIIIDVQFYTYQIPKEMCIFDGKKMAHFIFKPAVPYSHLSSDNKKQINWLLKNHLCIPYETGFCNKNDIVEILKFITTDVDFIYVKGAIKEQFLREHLSSSTKIINLENKNYMPKLEKCSPACFYHENSKCYCSINICKQIFDYILSTM